MKMLSPNFGGEIKIEEINFETAISIFHLMRPSKPSEGLFQTDSKPTIGPEFWPHLKLLIHITNNPKLDQIQTVWRG
jgi:hypothetical protein